MKTILTTFFSVAAAVVLTGTSLAAENTTSRKQLHDSRDRLHSTEEASTAEGNMRGDTMRGIRRLFQFGQRSAAGPSYDATTAANIAEDREREQVKGAGTNRF